MATDVVVEVRGGSVVGVYSADCAQRFILLDWDDLNELPERQRMGRSFPQDPLGEMPHDTRRVYERVISQDRERVE